MDFEIKFDLNEKIGVLYEIIKGEGRLKIVKKQKEYETIIKNVKQLVYPKCYINKTKAKIKFLEDSVYNIE